MIIWTKRKNFWISFEIIGIKLSLSPQPVKPDDGDLVSVGLRGAMTMITTRYPTIFFVKKICYVMNKWKIHIKK